MKNIFSFVFLLMMTSIAAQAQPINDNLCDAMTITIGADCNSGPNIDLDSATVQANEPFMLCNRSVDTVVYNSVWYNFIAPEGEVVILAVTDSANFLKDFQMSLFRLNGDCNDLSNLELVDCDVPPVNLLQSPLIRTTLLEGELYYLQISGRRFELDTVTFSSKGCLTIQTVTPPPNDAACNAILLTLDDESQIFSNIGASVQENEETITPPVESLPFFNPVPDGWAGTTASIEHSVWFTFTTPPTGGNIAIDLTSGLELGGNMNAQVAVYEVGDCSDFSTYQLIAASDNAAIPSGELFLVQVFPKFEVNCTKGNTTYYVLVDGGDNFLGVESTRTQGNFSIQASFVASNPTAGIISPAVDTSFVCTDDDQPEVYDAFVEGGNGSNSEWIITDTSLTILDLPGAPPFNFEGQEAGTSLIWHINYDYIEGLAVDSNLTNLSGCFALSDSIKVVKLTGEACSNPPTSTFESWPESAITISPNPAGDLLRVWTQFLGERDVIIRLRDSYGRVLQTHFLQGESGIIDISFLSKGHYFLEISNHRKLTVKRFIKL